MRGERRKVNGERLTVKGESLKFKDVWKKSGRRSPPVYRGRGPLRGEGVRVIIRMVTTHYSLLTTH